ncbi:SUPPRESSOR OF GAMMA RESPONSE 1-like [Lolium rigidum]|uniref:SUPPRESSOR OF GAMMA RESPONSE 1-like n=1 Tax=Lolium rigidum TaxID=89674 RepID=UPI001F5D9535|nr:SUPPRESSOR OF GAMMA RESPONSE 1-like [Lolium rigidum]
MWFLCCRTWLINSRGVAKKIRNANCPVRQISELGTEACRECPNCKHIIDNSDVTVQWPGLPAGVKFDPSDLELLEHLEHKLGVGDSKPHMFIDEFIPTVENDEGICYSHPENLPGTKKDGSSAHFFHRVSNAYACGQRKRRRIIHVDQTTSDEHVRWHKTGKSKPVKHNGVTKGWKKILVLYKSPQRGAKPDKADWVMHQYHLGPEENEEVGDFVVSKILYQVKTKQVDKSETSNEESDAFATSVCPKTPKTKTPQPCRLNNSPSEIGQNDTILQDKEEEEEADQPAVSLADAKEPEWFTLAPLAGSNVDDPLRCHEDFNSFGQSGALDKPIFSQGNEIFDGLPYVHGSLPEDVLLYSPPCFGSWQWPEVQD